MMETGMTRLSIALCATVLGVAAATPALADYEIIGFEDGRCEIWQQGPSWPWGDSWVVLASDIPDHQAAVHVRNALYRERICS
jgi:hypothetical protein